MDQLSLAWTDKERNTVNSTTKWSINHEYKTTGQWPV